MKESEFVYDNLTVYEPYKSYWTDFTIACYNNLQLGEYKRWIDVIFVSELPQGIYGSTIGDDSEVSIEIAMFSDGQPIPFNEVQKTIAHEMVHAQQYLSGRLVQCPLQMDDNGNLICKYIWCNKEYLSPKYSERPWELEAEQLEDVIVSGSMYDLRDCND